MNSYKILNHLHFEIGYFTKYGEKSKNNFLDKTLILVNNK